MHSAPPVWAQEKEGAQNARHGDANAVPIQLASVTAALTNELIYEVLKSVQAQVALTREDIASIKARLTSLDTRLGSFTPTWLCCLTVWTGLRVAWAMLRHD